MREKKCKLHYIFSDMNRLVTIEKEWLLMYEYIYIHKGSGCF